MTMLRSSKTLGLRSRTGLNDRAADNWKPLLAIATLAGGEWSIRGMTAAIRLSGDSEAAAESMGVQMLRAIKGVFEALGVVSNHV